MCNRSPKDYSNNSYLGLDMGTQKLKAMILDSKLNITFTAEVHFDSDLSEFGTTDGAILGDAPDEFLVNPVMWVKALDMVINCLQSQGADLHTVAAISGSTQQHGSVYWSELGFRRLCGLNAMFRLHEQLNECAFTIRRTPIWMDGSTKEQCAEMQQAIGGALKMAELTGSKCYARYTGPQIRKIYQHYPEQYERTVRISLISSFLASIFIGNIASIDYADGSGMNLLDIRTKQWSQACLDACAPDLKRRLMQPIASNRLQGHVAKYFVERWNFRPDCMVVAFTGDNLSSLSGMLQDANSLLLSLGNSDTIMMHLKEAPNLAKGHVLCHPTIHNAYMGLLCFRNGSLAREAVCRKVANGNWDKFNEMLKATPMGNFGNIAVHFHDMEIIPLAKGTLRWTKSIGQFSGNAQQGVDEFEEPKLVARAIIEGQMMHRRNIAAEMGFDFGIDTKIIVTGGPSTNPYILQIVANVFNAPVFLKSTAETALLGAAYRARYGFYEHREANCNCRSCKMSGAWSPKLTYAEFLERAFPGTLKIQAAKPMRGCQNIYQPLMLRIALMSQILAKNTSNEEKHVQFIL